MKLIACVDYMFNIGKDNKLLFNIPEDMKHFKETTENKIVVMGRKTFESIGHPLPNRLNIVITNKLQSTKYSPDNLIYMTMTYFLNNYLHTISHEDNDKLYVIGGAELYNFLLPLCDTLDLTRVHTKINDADRCIKNLVYEYNSIVDGDDTIAYRYKRDMYLNYKNKNSDDSFNMIRFELSSGVFDMWSEKENLYFDFLLYKIRKG